MGFAGGAAAGEAESCVEAILYGTREATRWRLLHSRYLRRRVEAYVVEATMEEGEEEDLEEKKSKINLENKTTKYKKKVVKTGWVTLEIGREKGWRRSPAAIKESKEVFSYGLIGDVTVITDCQSWMNPAMYIQYSFRTMIHSGGVIECI